MTSQWDGDKYQSCFDDLQLRGVEVHGEADLVFSLRPQTVLDAGCGTGRVAIELHKRGCEVVGVDRDSSMLATAQRAEPAISWLEGDLADFSLGRVFEVVLMAGNVLLFTDPGTQADVVKHCAAHVGPLGYLVSGFQLGRNYNLEAYDHHCEKAGLELVNRWSTWQRDPYFAEAHAGGPSSSATRSAVSDYAVSVHAWRNG